MSSSTALLQFKEKVAAMQKRLDQIWFRKVAFSIGIVAILVIVPFKVCAQCGNLPVFYLTRVLLRPS